MRRRKREGEGLRRGIVTRAAAARVWTRGAAVPGRARGGVARGTPPRGAARGAAAVLAVAVLGTAPPTFATPAAAAAQDRADATVEVPLRVEGGRLVVPVRTSAGAELDFILGLGMTLLTERGAERIGAGRDGLTLGGAPVSLGAAQVVPRAALTADGGEIGGGIAGVLGGESLNRWDVLIDVPGGRLLLAPVGRYVRWEGVELTSAVPLQIYHDVLLRTDVALGEQVFGALLDLTAPTMLVSPPAAAAAGFGGEVADFRMGYAAFPRLPAVVADFPNVERWDPEGRGFVAVGAPIAFDCAISVSWYHQELRTCVR